MSDKDKKPKHKPRVEKDETLEDFIKNELSKTDLYGDNFTIEDILSNPEYEDVYTSENFIDMMKRAGMEDKLPKKTKDDEESDSGEKVSKAEDPPAKEEKKEEKKEEEKKPDPPPKPSNSLDVANDEPQDFVKEDVIEEAAIVEVAESSFLSNSTDEGIKIYDIKNSDGIKLVEKFDLIFIDSGGDLPRNNEKFKTGFEKAMFEIESKYILPRLPKGEKGFGTGENIMLENHHFVIPPLKMQEMPLKQRQYIDNELIGDAQRAKNSDFYLPIAGNKEAILMNTSVRPPSTLMMKVETKYVSPEIYRENALGVELFNYCYLDQNEILNLLGDSLNYAYFSRLRIDKEELISNDSLLQRKLYSRPSSGNFSSERKATQAFLNGDVNAVSKHLVTQSRLAGQKYLTLAPTQTDISSRLTGVNVGGGMLSALSQITNAGAVTAASQYILFLTSTYNGIIEPDLTGFTEPGRDYELDSLSILSFLMFIDMNLIDPVYLRNLLSHFLVPFYSPKTATYTLQRNKVVEIPGIPDIVESIITNRENVILPAIVKIKETTRYDYANSNTVMKDALQDIVRKLFSESMGSLRVKSVDVSAPIKGFKQKTYCPIPLDNVPGDIESLYFGLIENETLYFQDWILRFRNNNMRGLIDTFLTRIMDPQRRQPKLGMLLRSQLSDIHIAGRTGLAIATSIMSATPDMNLLPADPVVNVNQPTEVVKIKPYDVLSIIMLGVTTPSLSGSNELSTVEPARITVLDHEDEIFSKTLQNITLPTQAQYRLNFILALVHEVYVSFKAKDPGFITKKLMEIEDCAIRVVEKYYSLSGDEKKLIHSLFVKKEDLLEVVGGQGRMRFISINPVFKDEGSGKFGNELFKKLAGYGELHGCSYIRKVPGPNERDEALKIIQNDYANYNGAAKFDNEKAYTARRIQELILRGYDINQFRSFTNDVSLTTSRKMYLAESRDITRMFVSIDGDFSNVQVRNTKGYATVISALETRPANVITLSDFYNIDLINYKDTFEIHRLQEIARTLKVKGKLANNITHIEVPLEKSEYELIEGSGAAIDEYDFNRVTFKVVAKEYTVGNAYRLDGKLPVLVRTIENLDFLNTEDGKIISIRDNAFNNTLLVPAMILYQDIARSLVGREILQGVHKDTEGNETETTIKYNNLYADGNVRVRCANGTILSEMRTVSARQEETVTIANSFESRLRL